MSRLHRTTNLIGVVLPFLGFVCAVVLFWNRAVGWADLAILAGMYFATAIGITVGFHRLFTHRAFDAPRPLRYTFAVLGSMAVQGPVIGWVADHRKHHAFTDREGDPHSPHDHDGGLRGLLHAHMGWLFLAQGHAEKRRFAPDLLEDRGMRLIDRWFPALVLAGLALPFGLGWAVAGTLDGALTGLLWGGAVRIFFVHHVTWSINSVCHFFGRRRFQTEDESTNVAWLALPTLGESWHHNHHAFPRSARHGLCWWEIDIGGLVISALERVGLARNVVTISRERQLERQRSGSGRRLDPEAVGAGPSS